MAFSDAFLDELKSANDIVSVVSGYANLKKQGKNQQCLCPFHSEKSPSCTVFPDTQSFYCFGCGAGGDVITFIMKIENLSYLEAVKFLCEKSGISMPEDSRSENPEIKLKTKIYEINRESARYFYSCLRSEYGKEALKYITERGLSEEMLKKYGVGYAPNSWNSLRNHLRKKGYTDDEIVAAKVATYGKNGSCYDFFRNRIMFPVIDLRGNVIAFGGRRINEQDNPKYINTSDTLVFKKSNNLFSLNFAKNSSENTLILAEGYMDVISIFSAGFENVVATLGTALTKEQARLMNQYADEIIIAYDSDGPGQKAAKRAIEILDEVGITTKVLKINGAKDPDEFIKKYGATRFKLLLENADNAINFELEKAIGDLDLENDADKVEYSKRILPIIAALNNPIERDIYSAKMADKLSIKKEIFDLQVKNERSKLKSKAIKAERTELFKSARYQKDEINPEATKFPAAAKAEEAIIAFLFRNNDALKTILENIREDDFLTDFNKRVFNFCVNALQTGRTLNISTFSAEFPPDEVGRINGIIVRYHDLGNSPQLLYDYIKTLKSEKLKLTANNAASLSDDELLKLQQNIQKSKQ